MPDAAQLKLENVRLSFPDIWEPKSVKNSAPKYGAHFLLDKKEHEDLIKTLKGAIWAAAKEHWGAEKAKKICGDKKFEMCLHEGSEKEDIAGYGDDIQYVTTSSPRRPVVVDRDRTPLTKDDRRPYGGCYVNGIIRLWVQDNEFGKRVNAELMGIQFVKDGEPFGAAPLADDAFADLDEGKGPKKKGAAEKGADASGPDDDEVPF